MHNKLTEMHVPTIKNVHAHSTISKLISKPVNEPLPHPGADTDSANEDYDEDSESKGESNEEQKEGSRDLWGSINESKEMSIERSKRGALSKMSFEDRLKYFANRKKEKSINIAMEMLADEQNNCTFTPRVNSCTRRNLKQFLKDQEQFIENRKVKLKQSQLSILEKEMMHMQSSPRINRESTLSTSTRQAVRSKSKGNLMTSRNESIDNATSKRSNTATKTRNKSQKRDKLQQELDLILNFHNPHKTLINFSVFCKFWY
jgi:hypothetical protein